MELLVGKVYEVRNDNRRWILRITDEWADCYKVVVLEDDRTNHKNYSGSIDKDSILMREGKFRLLDGEMKLKNRYRQTSDEYEVDKLIEHVQCNIKLKELLELIDNALETDNYEVFIELSKEYTKLKKKVTA